MGSNEQLVAIAGRTGERRRQDKAGKTAEYWTELTISGRLVDFS